MLAASRPKPRSLLSRIANDVEETLIAVLLGAMTLITFANVIARYVFNDNLLWALEATVFLFAWLVLIGASYVLKQHGHLGVDVVINAVSEPARRVLAILTAVCGLAFCGLLLLGGWDYWAPFAALPRVDGSVDDQAWYEVNDIPMIEFLRFIEQPMNAGEAYEKLPRFIPYAALPIGMALLTFRMLQLAWEVGVGRADRIIISHDAEDRGETSLTDRDRASTDRRV